MLQVAKVLKSNGTDGGLLLGFRDVAPEDIDLKEPVFIYFDGLPVPFFMDSFTQRGYDKAIVHLTGIKTLADAEEVVGREVFAEVEDYGDGEESLEDFIGWKLYDGSRLVGEISDIEDIPGNPCVYVGESMIPLHEDLIVSVDPEAREIHMELPEGLV